MQLPISAIGRIEVDGSEASALHIALREGTELEPRAVSFLSFARNHFLKRFRDAGLLDGLAITDNQALFDRLGRWSPENVALLDMRKILEIDGADRFTKASSHGLHAYRLELEAGHTQRIFPVPERGDAVYLVAGDISEVFYRALLENLRVDSDAGPSR